MTNFPKIIIIDKYNSSTCNYFIICFNSTLIIILETELRKIQNIFQSANSTIFFIKTNIKSDFINRIGFIKNLKTVEIDSIFESEIDSFSEKLILNNKPNMKFFKIIRRSISGYFIKQSYIKSNINRIEKYKEILETQPKEFLIQTQDYIHLRNLGGSNISHIELIYHIEREELFVAKIIFDSEEPKLFPRELNNYLDCHHPFLSRYFGTIEIGEKKCLGIEYIQGFPLSNIHKMNFSFYEKVRIVFEIMIAIQYIHSKGYIYRDLKPNNIIINTYKTAVIIDFDRMIKDKIENKGFNSTITFDTEYGSPELLTGKEYSKETDIYSLGKIIYFIFFENFNQFDFNSECYSYIQDICICCTQTNKNDRPKMIELLEYLYRKCIIVDFFKNSLNTNFFEYWETIGIYSFPSVLNNIGNFFLLNNNTGKALKYLSLAADKYNVAKAQLTLGNYYYNKDIKESIKYYTNSAKNNDSEAQYYLGCMYYKGDKVEQNIDKAIEYLTQSANQNYADAQFFLGTINKDLNKSFYYLKLAADQDHSDAQYNLAIMYLKGYPIQQDIDKAIYYLTKSADQDNSMAQCLLGNIYYEGKFKPRNIDKAIYYYTLSLNENEPEAACKLGIIYYEGKYVKRDINKGLNFIIKAANLNNLEAINYIGFIYYIGDYYQRDISKAIFYWKKASEKNYAQSLFYLGKIYYDGKYISKDIKQSIYYFEKASEQNNILAQYYLGVIFLEQKCIEKAIFYLKLSSNQGFFISDNLLGIIYHEGKYVPRDINLSIFYLSKAANQHLSLAQYSLGVIYFEDKYIQRNIEKSLYYFNLAAKQNNKYAQYFLGHIYFKGIGVSQDINKAIKYFSESAKQNYPEALSILGYFYITGNISHIIKQNINKGMDYLTNAANQGFSPSQFDLGYIYYKGEYVIQNIKKAIFYLNESANESNVEALYILGNIYYQGKYVPRKISESIKYFKEASSFNYHYAKNNLGIIYKNGIEVEKNISYAIELFKESIGKNDDPVSMYNLSHIYFFENISSKPDLNDIIDLLIKSIHLKFYQSKYLLILVLLSKLKFITLNSIENELVNINEFEKKSLSKEFYKYIRENELENSFNYSVFYEEIKKEDYVYDFYQPILSLTFEYQCKLKQVENKNVINNEFYEGLGLKLSL